MISECLSRRSKGLFWTSNFSAFRACIQLQNYIPELFVQVAAVIVEEGFSVLQKEHWQGWEWGVCCWGEGSYLQHTGMAPVLLNLSDIPCLSWHSPVQVSSASFLRKPVKPVDWHRVNSWIVDFQDREGRALTLVKQLPCDISSSLLFGMAIGILSWHLGFREVKQPAEDCIDYKWQNWFSNPGLSCLVEIGVLPFT